ncbi:MAG: flagellar assembly protein FliW [Thermodesulfobacteriota bacterium]
MKSDNGLKDNSVFPSARFGPMQVSKDKIIGFVTPLPGFEGLKNFVLIDHDSDGVFKWLQSLEDPEVAFLLTFPGLFKAGYTVPFRERYLTKLSASGTEVIVVFVMVAASLQKGAVSLNLKAPILFNHENMSAMQCIIDRDEYPCKFMVELTGGTGAAGAERAVK